MNFLLGLPRFAHFGMGFAAGMMAMRVIASVWLIPAHLAIDEVERLKAGAEALETRGRDARTLEREVRDASDDDLDALLRGTPGVR